MQCISNKSNQLFCILVLLIAIYSITIIPLTFFKYHTYQCMWDIALFCQSFYTTFHGQFFYNTLENVSYFGLHISPIIFIITPFYYLAPSPETLLIIQTLLLATGVIPIFLYCKETIGEKYGLLFSLIYLINPVLHGINLHEFHTESFIPLFIGMMLYGHIRGKITICLVFGLLSLMIKEDVIPIVGLLALIGIFQSYKARNYFNLKRYFSLFIASGVWLIASFLIVIPIMRSGLEQEGYRFFGHFLTGIESFIAYPDLKILFFLLLLVPFLFLPLFSPEITIIALPNLLEIFLPNSIKFFSVDFYYAATSLTIFTFATMRTWEKIHEKFSQKSKFVPSVMIIGILCSSCLVTINYSPAISQIQLMKDGLSIISDEHEQSLQEALMLIPPNSSLSTQHNLLTHCANRMVLYPEYLENVEYILLDYTFPWRASYYDDNISEIDQKYKLIFNESSVKLYHLESIVNNDK